MDWWLEVSLSGVDWSTLESVCADWGLPRVAPECWEFNFEDYQPVADWARHARGRVKRNLYVKWSEFECLHWQPGEILTFSRSNVHRYGASRVLGLLSGLNFEVAVFRSPTRGWRISDEHRCTFANGHKYLGWACAFKGAGHRHVCSRRFLEHGPWLVRRGPNDTTLVQFCDLEASPKQCSEQACSRKVSTKEMLKLHPTPERNAAKRYAAHVRMGFTDVGGYLPWPGYPFRHDLSGGYDAVQRKLERVVHGREMSQQEMNDLCALRAFRPTALGEDSPVERLAVVFIEERSAWAHLHDLWLREIEVWTFRGGEKLRLDLDYRPQPRQPEWVQRVLEREAQHPEPLEYRPFPPPEAPESS